jgi:hypothetical protein
MMKVGSLSAVVAAILFVAGCSSPMFYANYYADPKPRKTRYEDLKAVANPQPVYLVFDMYSAEGSFPEATRKLGPKIVRVLQNSGLFSTVSSVGSDNIARIQISMRETAILTGHVTKTLPVGLTSGLVGSKGALVYSFTASYQPPGKEGVKKTYPHAVHMVEGTHPALGDAMPLTAAHAVDAVVEQGVLNVLRELQTADKL